jgi:hypothetical protein
MNNNQIIDYKNITTHYIYLLQEREFIRLGENIYKVGKTKQENTSRLKGYPKGSILLFQMECINCDLIEKIIINQFCVKFKHEPDIGAEYFKGLKHEMIDIIYTFICKYNKSITINNDFNNDDFNNDNNDNIKQTIQSPKKSLKNINNIQLHNQRHRPLFIQMLFNNPNDFIGKTLKSNDIYNKYVLFNNNNNIVPFIEFTEMFQEYFKLIKSSYGNIYKFPDTIDLFTQLLSQSDNLYFKPNMFNSFKM